MVSRYGTHVKPEICLLPPPPTHYRMLPQQRAEFHVAQQPYVPQQQQPPNQTANQGPPLRGGMAPTGPPTQSSTPPNADLKVQQHVQQQQQQQPTMNLYQQQQRSQSYYQRPPQTNQQPRIVSQRPNQQQIYASHPTQTMLTPYQVVNVQTMPQYANYNNQRPSPAFMQPNFPIFQGGPVTYAQHFPLQAQQFYYNQTIQQRQPQSQVAPVAQGMTHAPQQAAVPMAPTTMQTQMQKKVTKKRSNAIQIINPQTMRPIDDEESHPTSGESSARQTPQPAAVQNSVKEVQATFAKQVAQAINDSPAGDQEVVEVHHHNAAQDSNVAVLPQQQQQQQQQQQPPPPAPFHQIPQNVHNRSEVVKSSKLQVPTSDFVPANNQSNTAKETPVVSAISNSVEVTIPGKPKDRESPAKVRKSRESANSQKDTSSTTGLQHKEAAVIMKEVVVQQPPAAPVTSKEVPAAAAAAPAPLPPQATTTQEVKPKEDHHKPKETPAVQACSEPPSKAAVKELPPVQQQQQQAIPQPQQPQTVVNMNQSQQPLRDDKKLPQQQQPQQAKKTESNVVPLDIANVVNAPQPAVNQDSSGKSKQTQRGKDQQKQAGGQQSIGQNNKPPPPTPTAPTTNQQQPPKSNKANKMKEINMKGANKEGTDMDAFNINLDAINANVVQNSTETTATATTPTPIQQQPLQPPAAQLQQPPATPVITETTAAAPKKIESNDSMTISKPEPKAVSKKIDITDIVKDTPKPFTPPPPPAAAVENKDETDRAPVSNDKIVQAKNEVNAKTAISNEPSEIKPLQYKENQWSPQNPDGKKSYDRDFLFALRYYPSSKTKPDNILNEVLAGDERSRTGDMGRCSAMGNRTDFAPSFGGSAGNFLGKSQSTRIAPKRSSQQGKPSGNAKGGKSGSMIRVSISFKEDVKLHETENAWKPARQVPGPEKEMSDDERKTEDLYKKVRGVLNKLTPQKFSTLLTQIKSLPIDSSERLQGVIDLVFEKAVDEPNFSVAYALMCRELALMQVPVTVDSKEFVNFRKLLVTRCQIEFEKNSSEEVNRNGRMKEIELLTDPEKKKEQMLLLAEDDRRIRMKSVGNIRFIGELFKQQMLTTSIMVRCLYNLIENEDEERLECLCKLLTTIGKELDTKNIDVSKIFDQMRNIVERKNGKVSSRVRFMLQDVIDLRSGGWVPRRTDLNPRTIDQIQKEADNEQMTIQAMNSGPMTPRKDDRNSGANSDRKRGGGRNVSDDGWSTAPSRGGKSNTFTVQSDKLKIQQPNVDEPLGSRSLFGNWGRGSNIKTAAPAPAGNMFAPLEKCNDMDNRSFARHKEAYNSKGSSLERGYKSYDGRNSRSGSQHRTQDSSQRSTPTPQAQPKVQQPSQAYENLSPEQLARRIGNIADEFISDCANFDETDAEVRTIAPTAHVQLVEDIIIGKMERSKTARIKLSSLFAQLLKRQTISLDNYCAALEKVFAFAEDLIVDIPQIWVFYAELLTTPIIAGVLPLNKLQKCADCLIQQGHARHLLAAIFTLIIQEKGPNSLTSIWTSSGLSFNDFMDSKLVEEFISKNRLEFLTGSGGNPATGQCSLTYPQIYEKLNQFVQAKTTIDDVFTWINANVGNKAKDNKFIRLLVTVYIENSIVNEKLNDAAFRNCYNILVRYIDGNTEFELQCLYAIQSIVNKLDHPQGLLLKIFNTLYEDNIISHDSFLTWEKSEDPLGQENKGVAVKQLTSFFTQMKETESENDSGSSSED